MAIWSKQYKSDLLAESELAKHIPESCFYNHVALNQMLKKYSSVYIKPDRGSKGKGVYRVEKKGRLVRVQDTHKYNRTSPHLPFFLATPYVIQQEIDVAKMDGRRTDIRSILHKIDGKWVFQGCVGKVGKKDKIVTNYCKGGTPVSILEIIEAVQKEKKVTMFRKIRRVSLQVAEVLSKRFPALYQLGIDLALDTTGHVWFIEANTKPGTRMFKAFKNKRMDKRIQRGKEQMKRDRTIRRNAQ